MSSSEATDGRAARPDSREIEAWLRTQIGGLLGEDPAAVSVHRPMAAYGVDSAEAAMLVADLEDWLDCEMPDDMVWEWATVRDVAGRLDQHIRSTIDG